MHLRRFLLRIKWQKFMDKFIGIAECKEKRFIFSIKKCFHDFFPILKKNAWW